MKNKKSETESKYKQMPTSLSVIVESFVLSEILKSEKRLQTADLKGQYEIHYLDGNCSIWITHTI